MVGNNISMHTIEELALKLVASIGISVAMEDNKVNKHRPQPHTVLIISPDTHLEFDFCSNILLGNSVLPEFFLVPIQ